MPRAGAAGALLMSAAAGLCALGFDAAGAQGYRGGYRDSERDTGRYGRAANGKPMLAIVALGDQRITIYDAKGKILESPVSSGTTGYETPAGIFSIVQKKESHRSNLYEDGEMPFMQRITWTGIALHAGALPGHPASHGCVRLPMSFARQLFDMTELGMRVVIVRDDMRPSDISHPLLFKSPPVPSDLVHATQRSAKLGAPVWEGEIEPGSARHLQILQSIAAARTVELEAATRREREARAAAARAASEAAAAARQLRAGEASLASAESALKKAESRVESASSARAKEDADAARTKAQARVAELQAQLESLQSREQARRDAADRAAEAAKSAAAAKDLAAEAADAAARKTLPVSVFVSRKTQRLYVRRGNMPIYEGPVTIRDPQAPLGTFVFTALESAGTSGDMRWNVVAMYRNPTSIPPASEQPRRGKDAGGGAAPSDVDAAKAALDRIVIGEEALDHIVTDVVLPGSSLIVSDEGPSRETGKDTDFVVVMSGEPQGALKIRQRERRPDDGFGQSPWAGSPWGGSPFFWKW